MLDKSNHFDFVDALRGYAILAVIVVHVAHASPPTNGILMRVFEQGARGVQLFYITSALTLLMSWHSRNDGYKPFIIRRIFRIVPLFWLAIPVYLLFSGMPSRYFAPPLGYSIFDILRSLLFLDAILPSNGSIVPGGWTVSTEMLFYASFPMLVMLINSWRKAVSAYLFSLVFVFNFFSVYFDFLKQSFSLQSTSMIKVWAALSLPIQFPVFLSGFVIFFLLRDKKLPRIHNKILFLLLIFSFCMMLVLAYLLPNAIAYTIPLAIFVFYLGRSSESLLINKPIIALGKVSFSAYLWHFLIINLIYLWADNWSVDLKSNPSYFQFVFCLVVVLFITYIISFITYRAIEQPLIKVGSVVANRVGHSSQKDKKIVKT